MLPKIRSKLAARILLLTVLVACAGGGHLMKFERNSELPKELPPEVQEKFEVIDVLDVKNKLDTKTIPLPVKSMEDIPKKIKNPKKKEKKQLQAKHSSSVSPSPLQPSVEVSPVVQAQSGFVYPVRRPDKSAIWIGEKQVYDVSYFGISAGDFVVKALPFKMVSGRKVYHIQGTAVSSSVFSLFYRLNDIVESFIDYDGIFTHRFHILLDETKQARDALELNDSEKGQTYYWNRWQRKNQPFVETKEYFAVKPFSQDSLSALYYLRSVPLPDGAVITFPVINEGKTWDAVITVLRREIVDSPLGKVRAIVLRPEAKYQGVLKKQGDQFLWLTDDDRRFMLRLEAKVKIGTVVAKLKEIELGTPPTQ